MTNETKEDKLNISNLAYSVQTGYKKHAPEFKQIFGVDLKQFMWNTPIQKITGFDVIEFDKWIESGDRCCNDVVAEKYGSRACLLIRELLAYPIMEKME